MTFSHSYIAGNFSPFHRGHMRMVMEASYATSGLVNLVVSESGREFISREMKRELIERCVRPIMPGNVNLVMSSGSPVRWVYELIDFFEKNKNNTSSQIAIWGTPEDLINAWSEQSLKKYMPRLVEEGRLQTKPVPRSLSDDVSATAVRCALRMGDRVSFDAFMPDEMDKDLAWKILRT